MGTTRTDEPGVDLDSLGGDVNGVEPLQVRASPELTHPHEALVGGRPLLAGELHDPVCHGKLGVARDVVEAVLPHQDGRRGVGAEQAAQGGDQLPDFTGRARQIVDDLEGIDDDELGAQRLDCGADMADEGTRTLLHQGRPDILVHHRCSQLGLVIKMEPLEIGDHLAQRLRQRGQVEHRPLTVCVGEQQLLGEERLPGAGLTHHDIDRAGQKPSAQD